MIFQMPVEKSSSYALGRITTDDIESEIRKRGIYVVEPMLTRPAPVPLDEPPSMYILPEPDYTLPAILPRPVTPVVILPDGLVIMPGLQPWLPEYPTPPEPELIDLYTPPYEEERIMPLTPTVVPEAKPESKVALVLIIAVVALVAFSNNGKGKQPTMARSRTA